METCKENSLTPKFLNFKLYREDIRNTEQYDKFQQQLLDREIDSKLSSNERLQNNRNNCINLLRQSTSWLDFNHFISFIDSNCEKKLRKAEETHYKNFHMCSLLIKCVANICIYCFVSHHVWMMLSNIRSISNSLNLNEAIPEADWFNLISKFLKLFLTEEVCRQ